MPDPSDPSLELKRLQRCMNDLIDVLALPAGWRGCEPAEILCSLADSLMGMLALDFFYARIPVEADEEPLEVLRGSPSFRADEIVQSADDWLRGAQTDHPSPALHKIGEQEISICPTRMGVEGDLGLIVAGALRVGFPEQTEALVLNVAANQAAAALQKMLLLRKQKRIASELDQRVAERTRKLAEINEELQLQVGLLQHLPVSAWTLSPDGAPDFVNQVWLEFSGQTLDFIRSHPEAWMTAVHPEDREIALRSFRDGVGSGQDFAFETRSLRAQDGTYRWHLQQAVVLRDADGKVLKFVGTTTDIHDQKLAEEALRSSEANLRRVIDTIPTLSWCNLPDGPNEFLSKNWHDYTGLSPEEAHGWGWQTTFHPDDLPPLMERWQRMLISGEPGEIEARIRRYDGIYRWFLIRAQPFRDDAGNIVRWYGASTDIHDRKLADEALRASERSFRQIVDRIPGLVCTMNATGEIEQLNQPLLEYFGKAPEELKNWRMTDAVHPDDLPEVIKTYTYSVTTGTPYDIEHRCRRADGIYRWFQVRALAVHDADNKICGWYVLLTDIEDRKQAEEALREREYESRLIINSIPGLTAVMSARGEIEFLSQPILDYYGKTMDEVKLEWVTGDLIHPEDLQRLRDTFAHSITSGDPLEIELRCKRFDGAYRWFVLRGLSLRDRQGQILRWYFLQTDINDRKRAEEAVVASQQNLSLTINTIPALAWSARPDGSVEFLSERWLNYTGMSVAEAQGWGWVKAFRPDDLDRLIAYWQSVLASGDPGEIEVRVRRFDGNYRWFLIRVSPLRDEVGTVARWYGINTDIDDRKRAEEELTRARAELAHVARVTSLGVLTASIAHEVSQPLSGIVMNAGTCLRMLDSDPPNIEGARETVRRTIRDGNRASEVVTRLRALFKRKEVAAEWVNLNDAAQEVIALSLSELQSKRIIVRHEFAENLPAVKGDRIQLQQVIQNLLRNASDSMSGIDDRPRHLLIRTESDDGNNIQLTVRDTGIGIDPEAADRLFDSFYTTKEEGTGIGLSVSRSIVEAHRGQIWATVNDGPGASFIFSIPSDLGSLQYQGR